MSDMEFCKIFNNIDGQLLVFKDYGSSADLDEEEQPEIILKMDEGGTVTTTYSTEHDRNRAWEKIHALPAFNTPIDAIMQILVGRKRDDQ